MITDTSNLENFEDYKRLVEKSSRQDIISLASMTTDSLVATIVCGTGTSNVNYLRLVTIITALAERMGTAEADLASANRGAKYQDEEIETLGNRLQAAYKREHELEDRIDELEQLKDKRTAKGRTGQARNLKLGA
jgi:hypothetical protein